MRSGDRARRFSTVILLSIGIGGTVGDGAAQPAAPAALSQGDGGGVTAAADDLRALVAPVALFPDPLLILILQASSVPIDLVKAERFLRQRERDPQLEPDPELDQAVLGLLNYPRLVQDMSTYIDWTDAMGQAVLSRLPEAQDTIQDIRWSAYTVGLLASNDVQVVTVEDDVVRILPADPARLPVPRYSGTDLLAALEPAPVEATPDMDLPATGSTDRGTAASATGAAAPAPKVEASSPPARPPEPPSAVTTGSDVLVAPPPLPATSAAPIVDYGETGSSFWSSAATFAGGAAIGGLLGYAIGDDWFDGDNDDNDWDEPDWLDDDFDADEVAQRLDERREDRQQFREDRRGDVVAAREERREDRSERLGDRQDARTGRSDDRQAGRTERQDARLGQAGDRQAGRAERQAQRGAGQRDGGPAVAGLGEGSRTGQAKREVKLPERAAAAPSKPVAGDRKAALAGKQRPAGTSASNVGSSRSQAIKEQARGAASRKGGDRPVIATGARNRPPPAAQQRGGRPQLAAVTQRPPVGRAADGGGRSLKRPDQGGGLKMERGGRAKQHADRGRQSRGGHRRG